MHVGIRNQYDFQGLAYIFRKYCIGTYTVLKDTRFCFCFRKIVYLPCTSLRSNDIRKHIEFSFFFFSFFFFKLNCEGQIRLNQLIGKLASEGVSRLEVHIACLNN